MGLMFVPCDCCLDGCRFCTLVTPAVNEVQSLDLSGATSGTFKLTFSGEDTAAIDYDATAADVQTALLGLTMFFVGDISATGGPMNSAPVLVEFKGSYAETDVAMLAKDTTSLVGSFTFNITEDTKGAIENRNYKLLRFSSSWTASTTAPDYDLTGTPYAMVWASGPTCTASDDDAVLGNDGSSGGVCSLSINGLQDASAEWRRDSDNAHVGDVSQGTSVSIDTNIKASDSSVLEVTYKLTISLSRIINHPWAGSADGGTDNATREWEWTDEISQVECDSANIVLSLGDATVSNSSSGANGGIDFDDYVLCAPGSSITIYGS